MLYQVVYVHFECAALIVGKLRWGGITYQGLRTLSTFECKHHTGVKVKIGVVFKGTPQQGYNRRSILNANGYSFPKVGGAVIVLIPQKKKCNHEKWTYIYMNTIIMDT